MPTYEFRCASCESRRDVRAGMAEADGLTLVCLDCGGSMAKAVSAVAVMIRAGSAASSPVRTRSVPPSAAGRGRTCTDGSVRLTRPNPFRSSLQGET